MRIGVIGAGAWGKNLVRNLSDLQVLAGVADALDSNRAFVSELRPDLPVFEDHNALLGSGIDAVAIATPAATHYPIAKQAMEAGLDVFVEKPMTLDVGEAEDLCALAKRYERVLMVGHLLMFQPAIAFIRDYLVAGTLGSVRTMHQRRSKLGRARSVENVMWSFGVHDIAVLLHLADEDPSDVQVSGHVALTPGVEDDVYLHLAFPSGLRAHLHNSWLWPKVERELIVVGERGMLEYDEVNQKVWLHQKTIARDLTNQDEGSSLLFEGEGQPLRLELEHFIDCCSSRKEPKASGASGLSVVSVLQQAEQQLRAS